MTSDWRSESDIPHRQPRHRGWPWAQRFSSPGQRSGPFWSRAGSPPELRPFGLANRRLAAEFRTLHAFPPEPLASERVEGRYEAVAAGPEHRHEPAFTERRYTTRAGDAVLIYTDDPFSTDDPFRLKHYLGAELHTGFFSVFWASRLSLPDAVGAFLRTRWADPRRVWLDPEEHRGTSQGIVIDERGVRSIGIARAIRSAHHDRDVHLLRLEYPTYTFVWRAPWEDDVEDAAEIGLMCQYRVDRLIAGVVHRTATEQFARHAEDVSGHAIDVVVRGL